jgi:hypothetical protein
MGPKLTGDQETSWYLHMTGILEKLAELDRAITGRVGFRAIAPVSPPLYFVLFRRLGSADTSSWVDLTRVFGSWTNMYGLRWNKICLIND